MTFLRFLGSACLALPLAACGGGVVPRTGYTPPPAGPPASAFMKQGPLLGSDARALTQMFGQPRLDIRETTVRKLQFANGRCILDAYLYAQARGKEPVVTHVDARSPTGSDVDPAACASALQAK
ncbi:hypothetical protein U5A82_20045 [Sphingobium sp. CR2-8]|uniref:hypothetical protein n=1 Tax=Sphingobium sp. CR2-8 TaxID=1306534 RepID=UPI002DBB6ACA|nr:hypothetical protein [Sphingobium sp. CR2-8]MEC3912681.1 hypothetical protein [Sphingobium sp. CR2-8]